MRFSSLKIRAIVGFFVLVLFSGCDQFGPSQPLSSEASREELFKTGQSLYFTLCIACHNPNPILEGPAGPAVQHASAALLEAKIVHGKYPEGYKPKRDTQLMPVFEVLQPQIPALEAFLNP